MLIKKGDIYRNKETNISCFIKEIKPCAGASWADDYVIVWCFKTNPDIEYFPTPRPNWEQVIKGNDGYIEYRVTKPISTLINEIAGTTLNVESYGKEDAFIMNWIPQHCFIAI